MNNGNSMDALAAQQAREATARKRYWRYIDAWTSETEIPMSFVQFQASDENRTQEDRNE